MLAPDYVPLSVGLSAAERSSILLALASSNAASGRTSVAAKFCKFWAFCAGSGTPPIPAPAERVLAFVQFLRDEGRVSVRSGPQYVSAITTVHRWFAVPDFSATTTLTKQLFQAWRLAVADDEARDQVVAFPAASALAVLDASMDSLDLPTLRAALVVGLDFAFFNRGDSAFPIAATDLVEEGCHILFRETRFKRKRADSLVNRVRRFNAERLPSLLACLRNYRALRVAHYTPAEPPPYFWQLRTEGTPSCDLIRQIFAHAATTWPQLFPQGLTHHSLRRGGATSAHAIGVPLETLCFWGGWTFGSEAVFRYIDFSHEATAVDFQWFGWMLPRAADITAEFLDHTLPPLLDSP